MHPALERFIQQFKAQSDVIIDSWFICDAERNIVDVQPRVFRHVPTLEARNLKSRKCHEVLRLASAKVRASRSSAGRTNGMCAWTRIDGNPLGQSR